MCIFLFKRLEFAHFFDFRLEGRVLYVLFR
nr:MAG TPA: hypothetical protein [Caudoviricetes sp.]